jgi:hypothetical protein
MTFAAAGDVLGVCQECVAAVVCRSMPGARVGHGERCGLEAYWIALPETVCVRSCSRVCRGVDAAAGLLQNAAMNQGMLRWFFHHSAAAASTGVPHSAVIAAVRRLQRTMLLLACAMRCKQLQGRVYLLRMHQSI